MDYEILEFKKNGIKNHFLAVEFDTLVINSYLKDSEYKIHSIRRVSDGEVFTVGNRIKTIDMGYRPINKIYLKRDGVYLGVKDCGLIPIHCAVLGEFLFITEDGVKLFKSDTYHWVRADSYGSNDTATDRVYDHYTYKYFSTEGAAKEYIKQNKINYSEQDMLEFATECVQYHSNGISGALSIWKLKNNK